MVATIETGEETGRLTIEEFDPRKHDAVITLAHPATGEHRTFWIRTEREGRRSGRRIVFLLTGPDNSADGDWRPFGDVTDDGVGVWSGYASLTMTPRFGNGRYTTYQRFAQMLNEPARFQKSRGVEYLISGKCRRCGRPLSRPESIVSGYGEKCLKKEGI